MEQTVLSLTEEIVEQLEFIPRIAKLMVDVTGHGGTCASRAGGGEVGPPGTSATAGFRACTRHVRKMRKLSIGARPSRFAH